MQLHMQADGMRDKKVIVSLIIILLGINAFSSLNYNIICKADNVLPKFYVDDDYNSSTPGWGVDHFDHIQDAINASEEGDRVVVYAGTYAETITITHKLDLFGEDREITTIDGDNNGSVIIISDSQVNISHFTIQNSGSSAADALIQVNDGNAIITDNILTSGEIGISVNNCNNNIIYDNTIDDNSGHGIFLNNSDNNEITYNIITDNSNGIFGYSSSSNTIQDNPSIISNDINGIFMNETSNLNTIKNNNISNNIGNGVFLSDHCNYNNVSLNDIYKNRDSGARIENSSYNTIYDNSIINNYNYGVLIVGSGNTLVYNDINNNDEHGIFLFADDNNSIYYNNVNSNTKDGIRLSNSTNDNISSNYIQTNSRYGIYLDYFTINNLIYNNYLYYNTYNGMDKSLSRNNWNITKTTGSNIAGGGNLSGNYWTDYDEISEGAVDSDGDGIADSSHTVYASNKDYGAILDVTPPSVGTPSVTPVNQTIGGYTYISVVVTDNVEIKDVYLVVTNPSSQTSITSILQNKNGNTYSSDIQYSSVGQYNFIIRAKDQRNWYNYTTNTTFYIREGTPPTITDNSPAEGSPGEEFVFNATVVDDQDSASGLTVKVNWTHGENSGNITMSYVSKDYFVVSVALDNSVSSLVYNIYASDQWENSKCSAEKTVTITDTDPPEINIDKHDYDSDGVIHTYTIGATIEDDVSVTNVTLEYWYKGSGHQTVDMDEGSSNYYDKIIYLDFLKDVYCIIRAEDTSGNENDSKNPIADADGTYSGIINQDIDFIGSDSFDLDGNITDYLWDFGDGLTGTGVNTNHSYSTNGIYTVTLTVTDEDGNTNSDSTSATIVTATKVQTTTAVLSEIESTFDVDLSSLFYAYDTDGDDIVDRFVDPNKVLKAVHTGKIDIDGDIVFLISKDDSDIPEFIWNSTTNTIHELDYKIGSTGDYEIDEDDNIVIETTISKTEGWIYIEVSEPDISDEGDISGVVSVTKSGQEIDSDKIFRKNNKVYFLDDPEIKYIIKFSYDPTILENAVFDPYEGSIIDENSTTIAISYNIPVIVIEAYFYEIDNPTFKAQKADGTLIDVTYILESDDSTTFYYTPPNDLPSGFYELSISAKQSGTTEFVTDYAWYEFVSYEVEEESIFSLNLILYLAPIIGIIVAIFVLSRKLNINFESFIYFRDKKIIPFIKPVVFGPLSIDVNDEKISKAEIYLNGELKDTLTEAPYVWKFDEPSFTHHKIETKVYDENGNTSSSGEMSFYVFNPRFFK